MDFYQILAKETKTGIELYPDFIVGRSKDLMVQGRAFYAIWDEDRGLWSRDEYEVQRLVDDDLMREAERLYSETGIRHSIRRMSSFNSSSWVQFKRFLQHLSDNSHPLNSKVIFANTDVKKTDYASQRLPYPLEPGDISAWNEMVGTLFAPDERAKIEWAIGSIVSGDSKKIQKFLVFYGPAGTGKSTILNVIQMLFQGYTTAFDGRALGNSNAAFATEAFKNNPLVAIQHDGDLSRLDDNTRLNSVVSHENMTMNEKYKSSYTAQVNAMLFVASNQPVKISDAKSGLIRRLIDVHPTGVRIPVTHYNSLLSQIEFELGAIVSHCLDVYLSMGKHYYNHYRPLEMMLQTDIFFNFVEAYYDMFKKQDAITLKQAYSLYKEYCTDSGIERPLPMYKLREELRNYFDWFYDRTEVEGKTVRSYYTGFNANKFKQPVDKGVNVFSLVMEETESLLDQVLADMPAQYAKADGTPAKKWENVGTKLSDLDTTKLHYVQVPENHIVIDFDLQDINGAKQLERNLEAASAWPPTYAEFSKSGSGIHLHYIYTGGNTRELSPTYVDGIEVKVFQGDSSLRRMRTRCNAVPISELGPGRLPLRVKEDKVLKERTITSEVGLRRMIEKNLRKEFHPGTKPSVDFIHKILEDTYESGLPYDVTDMRPRILAFANNSTHQAKTALKMVQDMKFKSAGEVTSDTEAPDEERIVFFDVEVYPNLFVVCWKYAEDPTVVRMINPKPHEIEALFKLKLVGFYNRRFDNHILYAASMGYSNADLYELTKKLVVENNAGAAFSEAYHISYADVWDFSSKRQGLKQFEIDLGIHHMELDFPWDKPVPEAYWSRVLDYCANDVIATEAVFNDRKEDFVARQILAELSGLTVNDTTQRHTAQIIFGDEKNPQKHFVYTDLSKEFPGYEFKLGKSSYRGEDPGEGGYVYAEPGVYRNVAVLDVASMHPASIEELNLFGPYTKKFAELKAARVAIKFHDYDKARQMLDGRLAPYLTNEEGADKLALALKLVINIVYGLTSAKFDNPFRDLRNIDNIVAKRGSLFMINLKHEIKSRGFDVVHIKTDSVKIPNAGPGIIDFVMQYGQKYGYEFVHETTYDKFCLVNDAVYVGKADGRWTAIGAQFIHPYVHKSLFTGEEIGFKDLCEKRTVIQGTMYLDLERNEEHNIERMRHLGKTGQFVPVLENGGVLYRVKDDKFYAVTGTKGHLWMDANVAKDMPDLKIDMSYFEKLKADALQTIEKFGSYEELVN